MSDVNRMAETLLRAAAQQESMASRMTEPSRSALRHEAAEQRAQAERLVQGTADPAAPTAAPPPSTEVNEEQDSEAAAPPDQERAQEALQAAARHRSSAQTLHQAAVQQERLAQMLGGGSATELLGAAAEQRAQAEAQTALARHEERTASLLGRTPPPPAAIAATENGGGGGGSRGGPAGGGGRSCLSGMGTAERLAAAAATAVGVVMPFGLVTGGLAVAAAPYVSSVTGIGDAAPVRRRVRAALRRDGCGRFGIQLQEDGHGVFISRLIETEVGDERERLLVGDYVSAIDSHTVWASRVGSGGGGGGCGGGGGGGGGPAEGAAARVAVQTGVYGADSGMCLTQAKAYVREAVGEVGIEVFREELIDVRDRLHEVHTQINTEVDFLKRSGCGM